jgi:hypothetical protein
VNEELLNKVIGRCVLSPGGGGALSPIAQRRLSTAVTPTLPKGSTPAFKLEHLSRDDGPRSEEARKTIEFRVSS